MQGVPELVEQRRDLVEGKQHRLTSGGLGDVEVVGHHNLALQEPRLLDVSVHPRPALLVVAGEVVGDEEAESAAVGVEHLKHTHVGLIDRQVLALLERQPIEFVRRVKHAVLHHAVELEVRSDLRLVEIVARLTHLL